jgi:hypothetical protein
VETHVQGRAAALDAFNAEETLQPERIEMVNCG